MLALIGHTWLHEIQKRAATVVDDDDGNEPDWVRVELTRALLRGIPVVPVLIEDALLPAKRDLPTELKGLRNRNGMELHARFFDDQTGRLVREIAKIIATPSSGLVAAPPFIRQPEPPATKPTPAAPARERWMSNEGTDNFGRWAEFEVRGIVQRMRWITPGEFWMGSPETEKQRRANEQRHRVIHTQGFWLADTACTQALWQAVGCSNPSEFTGYPLRPVEQVSWAAVQQDFLPRLNILVPGLDLCLPTEAQWEYACRAGTTTPFSFGENLFTAQANFDGNHPYVNAAKGGYRVATVPVKSLPPNAWGLYEMHGNVWEWCADGYGPYGADDAIDPKGVAGAASRVLRGGSWGNSAQNLRQAFRHDSLPSVRRDSIGFRVCRMSHID